jgi:hypothetical protein
MDRDGDANGFRAEDWWRFHELFEGSREQRVELAQATTPVAVAAHGAFDHVEEVIESGGTAALALIVDLLASAPEAGGAATVGAGPLEDLLHDHGDELIDEVERLARQDPAFSRAL